MLTEPVPTGDGRDDSFELDVAALVVHVLVRRLARQSGRASVSVPVSELFEVAKMKATWTRKGDNIIIHVENP